MSIKRGKFITFEGIDRCGKSTQTRLLKRHLEKNGNINCLLTAEPGGAGSLGTSLREILLNPEIERDEVTAALLFCADRHEHVKRTIEPALLAGRWVICDRFTDSTTAYQGGGGDVDLELLKQLNHIATNGLTPDLTVLLTLDAQKRAKRSPKLDYYDQGKQEVEQGIHTMFQQIAHDEPDRFVVLNGNESIEVIATQISSVVKKRLLSDNA